MRKNRLWLLLVTVGLILSLAACGPKATPVPEEATPIPKPAEATPTPKPAEATPTPPEGVTEVEPNNGPAEATETSMGLSTGVLTEDDEDWYKFEVPNEHILSLSFTPGEDAEPMDVYLLDPDQHEIWSEEYVGPRVTKSVSKLMSSSSGGTYYVQVRGGYGSYTIELSSESQNDVDSGGDAGDKVADALEVKTEQTFSGQIGDFDEEDWYRFEVPNEHILSLSFTPSEDAEPMDVYLLDPDQHEIWSEEYVGPRVTKSVSKLMSSSSGGTYYVQVRGGYGSYTIELSSESQNDVDSGGDAGDKVADALEVKTEQTFSGQIGDFDEEDWYRFTPSVGQTISFTPSEDAESMDVYLLDPDQHEIWSEEYVGPTVTKTFEITEVVGEPYYIQVSFGSGSYTIEIK
ncbi:MAG: pre-peptidase C-terminal domain-containing protein [Chloroflexota bacterium]|nr:pre-peptidase C-terminal domain-containing protein [Chloroflexota bacterium]